MTTHQPNYYRILGLAADATAEEIQEAASTLAAKFPQRARDPAANVAYRQLLEAYEVLSDPHRRKAYDARRAELAPELLEVSIQSSRQKLPALDTDQFLYLLVTLRAPPDHTEASLPLNLALIFDRSTSMRGPRLEQVKSAARQLIERLSPEDAVSFITFSDRARVVRPSGPVRDRWGFVQYLQGLEASGSTEIFQGLQAGVAELQRMPAGRYINHLTLLTDGQTYGDEEQCLDLARRAADLGITFSAFGIGDDWNEQFLDRLVAPSGGHSAYIRHPDEIVDFLRKQVQGLGATYAQNVRLETALPPGVGCNLALKLSPFAQPLLFKEVMPLGTVEARGPLSILLELKIQPQRVGTDLTIPLHFRADIPSRQLQDRAFRYQETLDVVAGESGLAPPLVVQRAVQMLNLYQMSEKTWEAIEVGNASLATKRMENLTTRLMEAGHTRLAEQAALEGQRLAEVGSLSPEGRKKLKYGTRALITAVLSLRREDD